MTDGRTRLATRQATGRIVAQAGLPSFAVPPIVPTSTPPFAARSSSAGSISWMSIFIRRVHGEAGSPARCRCGYRRSAVPCLRRGPARRRISGAPSGCERDTQREIERQRLARSRSLRIERGIVFLQANAAHPGRGLDHDPRADLDLAGLRHHSVLRYSITALRFRGILDPAEAHLGARHDFLRVGEIGVERRIVPLEARSLAT